MRFDPLGQKYEAAITDIEDAGDMVLLCAAAFFALALFCAVLIAD